MSTNDQDKVLDFGLTLLPNRQKASTKCTQLQDKHCRSLSQSCAQQDIGVIFNERSRSGDMVELSSNFIPGPSDVICGRGSSAAQHPGNTRFHSIISSNLMLYSEAQSKLDKSLIVSSIIKSIENGSPPGRFVKQINGLWCEVGDNLTREKCGQTLRDALHTQYKSSSKSKAGRRKIPKIGECNDIGKKKLKDVRYEPNIANSNILPGSRDAGNDEKVVMEHATDLLSELPDPMKMLKVSSHNDDRASRRKDNRGPPVCQGDDSDCDQKQSSLSLRGEKGSIESCSFDNQEFEYNGDFDLSDDDCSDQIISSAFWEG